MDLVDGARTPHAHSNDTSQCTVTAIPRCHAIRETLSGVPDLLSRQYDAQTQHIMRQLEPNDKRYREIPPEYGAAWPLDDYEATTRSIAGSFGYPSVVYKVIDRRSGAPYALRRVDGARCSPTVCCHLESTCRQCGHRQHQRH
jgi:PAB-dependent poly(A)-specific ribonuclease subunit 3